MRERGAFDDRAGINELHAVGDLAGKAHLMGDHHFAFVDVEIDVLDDVGVTEAFAQLALRSSGCSCAQAISMASCSTCWAWTWRASAGWNRRDKASGETLCRKSTFYQGESRLAETARK